MIELENCLKSARNKRESFFIDPLKKPVERINDNLADNPLFKDRIEECNKLLHKLSLAFQAGFSVEQHVELLMQTSQKIGELDFAAVAISKGLNIRPVQSLKEEQRSTEQAPDFQTADGSVFFEVKTLGIVNPKENYADAFLQNRQLNKSLDEQLGKGSRFASAIMTFSPYGEKPYKKGVIRGVIETIGLKLKSNIKPKQYANGNTFLVCNLYSLPLYSDARPELCPVYIDASAGEVVSGVLWMVAFAKPGNLIFTSPEFAGKPAIEGAVDFCGILQEFCFIKGIIWLSDRLDPKESIQTLLSIREQDNELIRFDEVGMGAILRILCDSSWNDEVGTNSFQLIITKEHPL